MIKGSMHAWFWASKLASENKTLPVMVKRKCAAAMSSHKLSHVKGNDSLLIHATHVMSAHVILHWTVSWQTWIHTDKQTYRQTGWQTYSASFMSLWRVLYIIVWYLQHTTRATHATRPTRRRNLTTNAHATCVRPKQKRTRCAARTRHGLEVNIKAH